MSNISFAICAVIIVPLAVLRIDLGFFGSEIKIITSSALIAYYSTIYQCAAVGGL
jgi:hypothetical protein